MAVIQIAHYFYQTAVLNVEFFIGHFVLNLKKTLATKLIIKSLQVSANI